MWNLASECGHFKKTPPFPSKWRYWKNNPTIQWCRTWCLSIWSRTGRWVLSTATPQAPHPGAKSMACQETKTTTKAARDLLLLHNTFVHPRSKLSQEFRTPEKCPQFGVSNVNLGSNMRPWWYWKGHCNTLQTSLPCHHKHHQGVGFAQWSCLDDKTSFLKNCPPNSLPSWKAEFNFNQQLLQQTPPTRSWNTCFWLTGFPNDGANVGKLLGCWWKNFSLDALRHIESLGHLSLCPI